MVIKLDLCAKIINLPTLANFDSRLCGVTAPWLASGRCRRAGCSGRAVAGPLPQPSPAAQPEQCGIANGAEPARPQANIAC